MFFGLTGRSPCPRRPYPSGPYRSSWIIREVDRSPAPARRAMMTFRPGAQYGRNEMPIAIVTTIAHQIKGAYRVDTRIFVLSPFGPFGSYKVISLSLPKLRCLSSNSKSVDKRRAVYSYLKEDWVDTMFNINFILINYPFTCVSL